MTTNEKIIQQAHVGMIRGKRFSPKEIQQYEAAVLQGLNDDRVEVMMLYFAESMHDVEGYGTKRTRRILNDVDAKMQEWLTPGFELNTLRLRVWEKTGWIFACDEEGYNNIVQLLQEHGYKVDA